MSIENIAKLIMPPICSGIIGKTKIYNKYIRKPFQEANMNVDHERKIIFIHIPKCAGKAIRKAISLSNPSDGADHGTPAEIVHWETWEEYFTFAVVRNPVDRMVSSYRYHTDRMYKGGMYKRYPNIHEMNLENYIDINSHHTQTEMTRHKYSNKPIDMILRFEKLQEDFERLSEKINIKNKLPKENVSKKKPIETNEETVKNPIASYGA
jgi:hypothetical protein